jgi:hypothetical protein
MENIKYECVLTYTWLIAWNVFARCIIWEKIWNKVSFYVIKALVKVILILQVRMGCDSNFTYCHTIFFFESFNNSVVSSRITCRLHLGFIVCCCPKLHCYQYETLAIMHSVNAKQQKLIKIRTCNSHQQVYYHNKSTYQCKSQQFTLKWNPFITNKRYMDNSTSIGVRTDVMRGKYDINIFRSEEKGMYTQLKLMCRNCSDDLTSSYFTFTNK